MTGIPAFRRWLDPRSLLSERARAYLERDLGFDALFAELDRAGPARAPDRERAARLAGVTLATFKRHFPVLAGLPWREFLRRWRVLCSKDLLMEPFVSEKRIARDCGFGSTSAYCRAFKAETGITPREFRESLEPGDTESFDEELAEA